MWIKVSPDRGELGLYITDEESRSVTQVFFFLTRSLNGKTGDGSEIYCSLAYSALGRRFEPHRCGSPTFRTSSANRGSERKGSSTKSVFKPTRHQSRS